MAVSSVAFAGNAGFSSNLRISFAVGVLNFHGLIIYDRPVSAANDYTEYILYHIEMKNLSRLINKATPDNNTTIRIESLITNTLQLI